MIRLFSRFAALLTLALAGLSAHATVVTLSGCASCNGGSYTLSYSGVAEPDADPLHETFRLTLHVDASGVAGAVPGAVALDAVSIKVASSVVASQLVAAPGALSDWHLLTGGIGAAGCSGSGAGFICADWVGAGVGQALGASLDFVFDVTLNNGGLLLGIDADHVKARYVNAAGQKVGALVSNAITLGTSGDFDGPPTLLDAGGPVPEPATLLMVLTALLGARMQWLRAHRGTLRSRRQQG